MRTIAQYPKTAPKFSITTQQQTKGKGSTSRPQVGRLVQACRLDTILRSTRGLLVPGRTARRLLVDSALLLIDASILVQPTTQYTREI